MLAFFVVVGIAYVKPENWHPFAPNGWAGIQAGAAVIFFAYIGFDAVSTVAEECRNPKRDLPIGILGSLAACTVIYIIVAAVLTGMIPWNQLNTAEPLSVAMREVHKDWAAGIVAFGSVVAHTAVLLVFQLGQPRIFFSMSRDGLLPKSFSKVHPRFKTPIRHHHPDGSLRGRGLLLREPRRDGRPVQHRHALGLHHRLRGDHRPASA